MIARLIYGTTACIVVVTTGAPKHIVSPTFNSITTCSTDSIAPPVRCGSLAVREDRNREDSRTITIAYELIGATTPSAQPPMFYFAGGPGQSAIAEAKSLARRFAALRATRDIVLIDFRGMGESNALDCSFNSLTEMVSAWHAAAFVPQRASACRADLEKRADLKFYSTDDAVYDVDAVRAALGYQKINVVGASYGSRAALTYLRRFPDRVGTLTLVSVSPPNHSIRGEQSAHAERSLNHVLGECAGDTMCSRAFPHVAIELDSVLARLDRAPMQIPLSGAWRAGGATLALTRDAFTGALVRMLYGWAWARVIPAVIHDMYENGGQAALVAALLARQMDQGLALGAWLSYSCAEDVAGFGGSRGDSGRVFGETTIRRLEGICASWPASTLAADFRAPLNASVPTLIISGSDDPATPPAFVPKSLLG